MEEAAQYNQCTKEELIQIIVAQNQTIRDLKQMVGDLKKEVEALKPRVPKESTNSSIPSSKELIPRTRSQREKSGQKPGGKPGHVGSHRERNPHPDCIVKVQASHCADCGALPYERLSQITHDLLGFAISEGTVANKLARMHLSAKGLIERIKQLVMDAPWIGSDETGTSVAGKTFWEWVWQSPLASSFVIDKRRGYGVVKEHFTERYKGVICHDCWCAQNKTPAGAHQLCHAHLLRNLQYAVDAERSVWAYRMQQFLRKSQRAREKIWQEGACPKLREAVIRHYQEALDGLLGLALTHKEERRLQKRLIKHKDWILTFLAYPDVPPDNNSSERAIKAAKLKDKVSGGFRCPQGASRFAQLLSLTQTLRKQKLPILATLTAILQGNEGAVSLQST